MTAAQRRDTLMHELLHLERGRVPYGRKAAEEEQVRRLTAMRLLPDIAAIGDALAWACCPDEAAEELGVSTLVLTKRLAHLHPSERGELMRRLAE